MEFEDTDAESMFVARFVGMMLITGLALLAPGSDVGEEDKMGG